MGDQQIEFRKLRDFGENLNDTFLFIRLNFGPLIKSFFAICAVFMLALAIFSSMYQSKVFRIFGDMKRGMGNNASLFRNMFDLNYFLMLVFAILTYVAMKVSFNAYIKYQLENEYEKPGIDEVWTIFKQYYFRVLLYSLLLWCILVIVTAFIGGIISVFMFSSWPAGVFMFLLMFVALIYMFTVFVPFDAMVMMEDAGFYEAFTRCFELIKNNFLFSLAVYFVGFFIYGICSGIIALVTAGIIGMFSFVTADDISSSIRIATSVLSIFSYTFYIIFLVSSTLHYFSLVEKKDGTGILQRINAIGSGENDVNHSEEHY